MVFTPRRRRLARLFLIVFVVAGCIILFQRWTFDSSDSFTEKYVGRRSRESGLSSVKSTQKENIHVPLVIPKAISPSQYSTTTSVTWIPSTWTPSLRGHLNVHVWLDWCGTTINDLRRNVHFPKYPDIRLKTTLFYLSHDSHNYGQRVFGYLHPPKTGYYKFAISSDDSSELWLSTDEVPTNSRLIAWVGKRDNFTWAGATGDGQFTKYKSQISKDIFLNRGQRYFVEALHKQSSMYDHLLVAWKLPRLGNFSHISRGRISQYINSNDLHNPDISRYGQYVPLTPATLEPPFVPERLREAFGGDIGDTRRSDSGSPSKSIRPVLHRKCPYSPSYLVDFNVTRYEGVYLVHETAVYPNDHTHLRHVERYRPCSEGRIVDSHGQRLTDLVDEYDEEDFEINLPTQLTKPAYQTNKREILLSAKAKTVNLRIIRSASMKDDGDTINDLNKFNKRKGAKIGNEALRTPGGVLKYEQRHPIDSHSERGLPGRTRYEQQNTKNKNGNAQSSRTKQGVSKTRPTRQRAHHKPVHKKTRSVVYDKKGRIWRRTKSEKDWSAGIPSNLAVTMRRLKMTGLWDLVKAYAKENGLLFTKKTWMYVVWKYLRYHKPRGRAKIVEFLYKQNPPTCRTDGNILLNEDVANGVILKYLKDLRSDLGRDFQLQRIITVQENHDVLKGDRYFLELELQVNGESETLRLSDYVYLPLGEKSFCSPQDFLWRTDVTVHVIVPVKNLGKWVQHFIDDMSELCQETQDPYVNVIIVDFNSTDIDIEQALTRSALKRYQLVKVNGSFQRALGIQIGADAVKNPNDIIFTCDLHLEIPNNLIDIIRKHCVQGKMAFSPMVMRLECGFTPSLPYGEWETVGFGLFAMYKSDFARIGGMNHEEFKTKWGGEDWEMVDRFLQYQMEIERLRVPRFYHFYHSKYGMWGEYDFEDIVSGNVGRVTEDEFVKPYNRAKDYASRYSYNEPLIPQILMP